MPPRLPPLAALRAFAAVARQGGFARAAAALNVSTSAISHQIRALEAELGTPLLTRARNGAGQTEPTAEGTELLGAVEAALARLGETCDSIRGRAHQARPRLTVAANGSFASLWLAPRLAAFAGRHPSTAWTMRSVEEERPDLQREGIDLAILRLRTGTVRPPDQILFEEVMFPVCSPALAGIDTPEKLLGQSLLEEAHGANPEMDWRHWLGLLGLPPAQGRIIRFSSFNQVIAAALAGAGVALGRVPLLDAELAAGRLVRLFAPRQLPGSWAFVLHTRPGLARDPHVAQLRDFLLTGG
ncbi:LysR substrate-binding domain-containing protein [Falsiroseomonas tokyonensis]|uniref:LysR substrate-binding domain-containing protein n=1 Tax=Falsiroseomonas tokyonensis TaxID=430521 RepID=A0ABV7BV81_9PROT|nr:LysR substrate-binding domain-containing protein [Falsiroseomonas tokyonensis]MBU8539422.1 LysR family transcriptional regulator [Falsiroseomonas tokyonensis]